MIWRLWEVQAGWVFCSSKEKSKQLAKISLIVAMGTIIGPILQEEEKGKNAAAKIWQQISEPI